MTSRFRATLIEGHKGCAVEVPFDPAVKWDAGTESVRPGRRGHPVRARVNGVEFDSWIVKRSRRYWLLVDDAILVRAEVAVCDVLDVSVEPLREREAARAKRPARTVAKKATPSKRPGSPRTTSGRSPRRA